MYGKYSRKGNDAKGKHELEYNYNLQVGQKAPSGGRISRIYAHEKDKYLIYSTDSSGSPIVIAENEDLLTKDPEVCKEILQIRDYKYNDPHLKRKYNEAYAQALRTVLDKHYDAGLASLKILREEIEGYLKREAAFWYLLGAAIATLIVLSLHLFFYLNETHFEKKTRDVFYAVVFSTLGGFLSVAIGSGKIKVEIQNSEWIKSIYGALRITIAIVSGVLVYYAILGEYVLAMLKPMQSSYAWYTVCAAAGFLEKFVPNMMLDWGSAAKAAEKSTDETKSTDGESDARQRG
jgi:hypothetical protein